MSRFVELRPTFWPWHILMTLHFRAWFVLQLSQISEQSAKNMIEIRGGGGREGTMWPPLGLGDLKIAWNL